MSQHVSHSPAVPGSTHVRSGKWTLTTDRSAAAIAVRNFGFKTVRGAVPLRSRSPPTNSVGRCTRPIFTSTETQ